MNLACLRELTRVRRLTVAHVRDISYGHKGVPLEDYVLTRADHRKQKQAEETADWAERAVRTMAADRKRRLGTEGFLQHQIDLQHDVRAILARKTPDDQVMRWRLRLYCGHVVTSRRHANIANPTMHGSSSQPCPECGVDPASIVAYEPVGLVKEPVTRASQPAPPPRLTRGQLEKRVRELETENERLQGG